MLSIYSNQRESRLPPCRNYSCLIQSILSSLSLWSSVYYCVFSPNPCNIHIDTLHTALPFACSPSLSLWHSDINSDRPPPPPPPPPGPTNLSRSLTRSHSLETIVKQLTETLGKHQIPPFKWGAECKNPTAAGSCGTRLRFLASGTLQTQEICNVPKL